MITWFRRVWHLLNRSRRERELLREMHEHRDAMHDPSAFGDTYRLLEQSRDAWGWNWLDDAMQDLMVGVRTLMKSRSFAITATLILTFGIGLNLTLFQVVKVAMLRPPAIKHAESWVRFLRAAPHSTTSTVPYPLAQFVKEHGGGVLAAVTLESDSSVGWGRDAGEQIPALFVSTNWFDEVGYGAAHGRVLAEGIDDSPAAPVVVVSYRFWKTRLGGDPSIVGTTAYIDRKPATIVGVAPEKLPGLDFNVPAVFIPLTQRDYFYPGSEFLNAWDSEGVDFYGRLRERVSAMAAREALRVTMQAVAAEHPEVASDEWLEPLVATDNFMRADERISVLVVIGLMGALTSLVLIVAAANLGNLVMSRATGRVRELGVRMALGARRTRIVRQLIVEAIPLAALGVAGSLLFAAAATGLVARFADLPPYFDFRADWSALALAIGLGTVALLVIGVLPAWKIAQQHLVDAVRDGGQHLSRTLDRALMRRVMVAAQVGGSCLLLIVAGMMARSVQRAMHSSLGFDYQHAAVLSMPLDRFGITGEAARSYWYQVKDRVRANPEVADAAIVTAAPLGGRVNETVFDDVHLMVMSQGIDPEYFSTMQIPMVAGRSFGANEQGTVVVSRRLALQMYGTLDVLGQAFPKSTKTAPESTIVGVAADAHSIKVEANNVAEVYRPLKSDDFSTVFLVARATSDADRVVRVMREASVDPRVVPAAHAMHEDFDRRMTGPRIASAIAAAIGVLTLGLACLGIFGVVSYGVALRTKEIGIRVALGARHPALLGAIVRQVLTPVGVGVAIGLVLAVPAGVALQGEPFYLESADPLAFIAALTIFAATGAVAALWPAYLVLRGNPVEALRHS